MIIEGDYTDADWFGEVRVDGQPLDPAPSQKVWNHSPDGFAWGYGGSGPSQLALAILLAAELASPVAVSLHQRFKAQFLAPLPRAPFRIEVDIDAWAAEQTPTTIHPSNVREI